MFVYLAKSHKLSFSIKKIRKKLRYFWLPPILAHQKLIGLANCVAVSAPQSVISFMQWSFKNWEKWKSMRQGFAAAFAKNESLYQQISTKYKSSKLFWRILEDKKRNRRENCSRKTVRIFVCNTPSQLCMPGKFFTHNEFPVGWLFAFKALLILMNTINKFKFRFFCV